MLDAYVYKNNQKMRMGYTTGSCAAGAAKAAAALLLLAKTQETVELMTPKGILLTLPVEDLHREAEAAVGAVRKDGGDDPDATHGLLIYARVWKREEPGVFIDGGEGVGRVTKPGLEQPVGNAAINRVPRQMIREAVEEICAKVSYTGGIGVEIFIPGGEKVAEKTFNPRLGIVGGISVLGTSGIVEPMSEAALIETIRVEMRQRLSTGREYLVIVPGNYGIDFMSEAFSQHLNQAVKCSNFVGEAIDSAVEFGAKGILLIGHIGKFVKLAAGIMNTHSRNADARAEIFAAHAACLGAEQAVIQKIMDSVTTDEALQVLEDAGLTQAVMERLMKKIDFYVHNRAGNALDIGVITFSKVHGKLGETKKVKGLLEALERQEEE